MTPYNIPHPGFNREGARTPGLGQGRAALTVNLHPDAWAGVPGGPAAVLAAVRRSHRPQLQETPLGQDLPAGILLKPPGPPSAATQHHPQHQPDGAGASQSLTMTVTGPVTGTCSGELSRCHSMLG